MVDTFEALAVLLVRCDDGRALPSRGTMNLSAATLHDGAPAPLGVTAGTSARLAQPEPPRAPLGWLSQSRRDIATGNSAVATWDARAG